MPQIEDADFVIYNHFLEASRHIQDATQQLEFHNFMHALDSLLPPTIAHISKNKMYALECMLSHLKDIASSQDVHDQKGGATNFVRDYYQAYFIRLAEIWLSQTSPVLVSPTHHHHDYTKYSLRAIITDFQRELDRYIDMKDLSYEYKTQQQLSELLNILSFLHAHGLHVAHIICQRAFKIRLGHHWSVAYRFQQHLPSLDIPDIEDFRLEKYLHPPRSLSSKL